MFTKTINVYFSFGINSTLDSTRGIGANNRELQEALKKYQKVNIAKNLSTADIIHYTKFHPFFISLPFKKPAAKVILTIHDLIPLIYPKHYPPGIKGSIKFQINKFLIKKNVDKIVTISETSKKDIVRFLGVDPNMIEVIYLAPKSAIKKLKRGTFEKGTRKKFNLPQKFVLFDHGVNYNKNLPTLIEACRKVNVKLAIIGKETENIGKLDLNHAELKHLKGVDFSDVLKLGYVSDEDLNKLFNLADVYVQPSFYEGFGMPVVEAMRVGCPVICSKTQALVEIAGNACLYFDPYDVDDLSEKIRALLNNNELKSKYINLGYEQTKKYSWQKCANQMRLLYKKVLNV